MKRYGSEIERESVCLLIRMRERERYFVYLSTSTDDIEDKYFLSNKHFSELTKRPSTKSSTAHTHLGHIYCSRLLAIPLK